MDNLINQVLPIGLLVISVVVMFLSHLLFTYCSDKKSIFLYNVLTGSTLILNVVAYLLLGTPSSIYKIMIMFVFIAVTAISLYRTSMIERCDEIRSIFILSIFYGIVFSIISYFGMVDAIGISVFSLIKSELMMAVLLIVIFAVMTVFSFLFLFISHITSDIEDSDYKIYYYIALVAFMIFSVVQILSVLLHF